MPFDTQRQAHCEGLCRKAADGSLQVCPVQFELLWSIRLASSKVSRGQGVCPNPTNLSLVGSRTSEIHRLSESLVPCEVPRLPESLLAFEIPHPPLP